MNQVERIGRFEVQERLRANPFAIVYRGRDPFDGRRVQIKFCVAADERIRRRFLAAAQQGAGLRHPNIATIFEYGSGDGKPYLVQEAFSEENLSDLLARGEPVEDVLKLYYLVQVAQGLQHAHQQEVLHRELRPASILVHRSGDAKITDFGIARLASTTAQLGTGAHRWPAVGWLLPELLLGLELDARSDIYEFGALAFELLTGQAPFVAESLASLVPQILESDPRPLGVHWPECPPELDRLVLRCLARDPGQRFESMDELVEELGTIVPVSGPADIFEEEKTMIIEDINSLHAAQESGRTPSEERVTAERPLAESPPRIDWSVVLAGFRSRGRQATTAIRRAAQGARKLVGSPMAFAASRGRAVGLVIMALLLFGVVGWSLVGVPDSALDSLPTVAPERPVMVETEEKGLLIVDTQPWGQVLRVVDANGDDVDLSEGSVTPLRLELAAGAYRVELSRPDLDGIETCFVTVADATTARCEPQLAVLETEEFFKHTGWWQ